MDSVLCKFIFCCKLSFTEVFVGSCFSFSGFRFLGVFGSYVTFFVRWLSLGGTVVFFSEGRLVAGISRFLGGRYSLFRFWLDFIFRRFFFTVIVLLSGWF